MSPENSWGRGFGEPEGPYTPTSDGDFQAQVQRLVDLQRDGNLTSIRQISRQYPMKVVQAAADDYRMQPSFRGVYLEIVGEKQRAIQSALEAKRHQEQIDLLKATEGRLSSQIAELKIGNTLAVDQLASTQAHHATAKEQLKQSKPSPVWLKIAGAVALAFFSWALGKFL